MSTKAKSYLYALAVSIAFFGVLVIADAITKAIPW